MGAPALKPVTVQLAGEQWAVEYRSGVTMPNGDECWGVTDFARQKICIDRATRKAGNEREIALHEALHVLFPQVDEEVICAAAKDLDSLLETLDL